MVDVNIANFFTVGLLSVAAYAALKYALAALGINVAWLA